MAVYALLIRYQHIDASVDVISAQLEVSKLSKFPSSIRLPIYTLLSPLCSTSQHLYIDTNDLPTILVRIIHKRSRAVLSQPLCHESTMTSPTRKPPAPVVLLVYPITLLVGSLFSMISPTARASRASSGTSPSGALAPSLAADLHISESPVNYFARKNNIFNVYFVKIGWLWTTLAFASLLICQPAYRSSSQQQTRSRRILQAVLRYAFATSVWYLMTQWFFGPAIIDRGFVVTGGKCEQVMDKVENLGPQASESPSAQLETLFSAAACKAAGGAWAGGHDISGHVFMLVLATAFLSFEAIGVGAFAAPSTTPQDKGEASRTRKSSDPASLSVDEQSDSSDPLRRWCLRLVWGVVGLGWWMLFMTAIWFHTWLEKVRRHTFTSSIFFLETNTNILVSVVWFSCRSRYCIRSLYSS